MARFLGIYYYIRILMSLEGFKVVLLLPLILDSGFLHSCVQLCEPIRQQVSVQIQEQPGCLNLGSE